VDVVVTNPGGQRGTLARGYTYEVVTLTVDANRVTPGGQLSVTWVAPSGRSVVDWIVLLKVGEPSTNYASAWWQYTKGATAGTFTINAPDQSGEYEFRYLLDDDYIEVARSGTVTVSAAGTLRF
jgi:ABC-type Fe3+ transport system substrate-binding protein